MKKSALILTVMLSSVSVLALASSTNQDPVLKLPDEAVKLLFEDTCRKGCSDEELALWKSNLKSELHDLNSDGVSELFLYIEHSDWCGAGANCSYWVYQKAEAGYKLLIKAKVLRVKDTVTNGYRDLSSETPMGFCDRNVQRLYVSTYKYNGRKYQAQKLQVECKAFTPKEN
jgi:hypothetical protein